MTPDDIKEDKRNARRRLVRFLSKGGVLVREEIGGAVGVAWRTASRSGEGFPTEVCEKVRQKGCRVHGAPRKLVKITDRGAYAFEPLEDEEA